MFCMLTRFQATIKNHINVQNVSFVSLESLDRVIDPTEPYQATHNVRHYRIRAKFIKVQVLKDCGQSKMI